MNGGVPDSDDEGHVSYHSNRQNANLENQSLDKIYSDDEGDVWPAANYHSLVEATPHPQAVASRPQKMFSIGRKATLTGAVKAPRQQQGGRKLVSSAVVARQHASAVEEETSHQENELSGIDWSLGGNLVKSSQQSVPLPAPSVAGRPAFVGRAPPPALRPLPRPKTKPATAAAAAPSAAPSQGETINKLRTDSAPQADRSTLPAPPPTVSNGPSYLGPPPSLPAAAPAAPKSNFGSGVATHLNDDGMNVVYSKRKRSEDDQTTGQPSKARATVNSGWGNNFVRIDMKVR
jgi:hypothetical protein